MQRRRMIYSALLPVLILGFEAGLAGQAGATSKNSITTPDTAFGGETSLTLDTSGFPVVAYGDGGLAGDLRIMHCNDANCDAAVNGAENIQVPDTISGYVSSPSLALDSLGNPVVSYRGPSTTLKLLHCNDANCDSTVNGAESIETLESGGGYPSLALDAAGNPVVSYANGMALKIMHCNDANCDNSVNGPESIQSAATVAFSSPSSSLAVDGSGNPIVSYGGDSSVKILHCNDANCDSSVNGPESIQSPNAGTSQALEMALELDASGFPVVGYRIVVGGDMRLRVLHCNDADCDATVNGAESVQAPDTSTYAIGPITSLALDASGNPVVGYWRQGRSLNVLHCNDANCDSGINGSESAQSPDVGADTGYGSSIALAASGNPIVSYMGGGSTLRVLHCINPYCPGDIDSDGCPDVIEQQTAPGSELTGGRRNAKNPNDYFNPTHDGMNRIDDVLAVVDQYFVDQGNVNYRSDTDRTLIGPNAWNLGPPNGLQRVDDIVNIVKQYYDDCS